MTRSPAASCATDAKLWRLEFGAEFTIVFVDTAIDEIGSRRDANNQRPTRHHVRDDIFEDHCITSHSRYAAEVASASRSLSGIAA
jgi:hypothetical protein